MVRTALLALILFGSVPLSAVGQKPEAGNTFPEKINRLRPSIVEVQVGGQRSGTGFFVSPDGYVLTALHVVAKSELQDNRIAVTFLKDIQVVLNDGRRLSAEGVKNPAEESALHDIGLIKVEVKSVSFLQVGTYKDAIAGEDVYFMGFPFDAPGAVTYKGMISAKFPLQTGTLRGTNIMTDTLQIEAPIARGFSGAPVLHVNDDRVVGIVTNRLGGITPGLAQVAQQIVNGRSVGTVRLAGVDPNEAMLETIKVLDQFLSAGAGWAVSVDHIAGLLLDKKLLKSR